MEDLEKDNGVQEVAEEDENQALMEIVLNTREQGEMMEQLIKNQICIKDGIIDKLHKELEYYKQDSANRFVNEFMKSIIKVKKDMRRLQNSEKWNMLSEEELRQEYAYISDDLSDLLELQNVDFYETKAGELFDPAIHQAKVEVTDMEQLDKTIKISLSEGYMRDNKVLVAEKVIVYKYQA